MTYLQSMDTRQYLYCLKPKPEYSEKAGVIKGVTVIGKLDIVWKTNLGERGRLQTSQLQRMVSKCLHNIVFYVLHLVKHPMPIPFVEEGYILLVLIQVFAITSGIITRRINCYWMLWYFQESCIKSLILVV